jgi:hypothetical protein
MDNRFSIQRVLIRLILHLKRFSVPHRLYSATTSSVYLEANGVTVRIADHPSNSYWSCIYGRPVDLELGTHEEADTDNWQDALCFLLLS